MENLKSKVEETFQKFGVNKKFPEFLDRAIYIESKLKEHESLVIKHESRDSPGRFGVHDDIDMMNAYIEGKDDKKELILSLDATGRMSYNKELLKSYKSSDWLFLVFTLKVSPPIATNIYLVG